MPAHALGYCISALIMASIKYARNRRIAVRATDNHRGRWHAVRCVPSTSREVKQ